MRVNIGVYYELWTASDELYTQFLEVALAHSANYPGWTTPGLVEMHKSGTVRYAIYNDPDRQMTLEEYIRVTMANPRTLNYFVINKVTKAQYAYISVKKLSNTSVEWVRILPVNQNIRKIYGSTLQDCLQKILSSFVTGTWTTHTKDRSVDDVRCVISGLNGVTVDICGEVHFSFDRQNPILGIAAYKPNSPANDAMKIITVDEIDIPNFEEALKFF